MADNVLLEVAGGGDPQEDGRRLRRERNRTAVVDAMLELYRDGNLAPTTEEIAARAGLSPRSLFRYFDDLDDLVRAAITRHIERVMPSVALDVDAGPDATCPERIAALVRQRMRLFDAIGSVGQISRLRAPFQPLIATQLRRARAFLRDQIAQLFAPELAALGPAAEHVLAAADILCSFEAHQLMRDDLRLAKSQVATTLTESLTRLLFLGESST